MIVNLTPHPIHVFPADCPDRIEPGSWAPALVIPPHDGVPARVGEIELGPGPEAEPSIPIVNIAFGSGNALPVPTAGVWLFVSRPIAMVNPDRRDLLVPFHEVRNLDGSVIGCRALARPV